MCVGGGGGGGGGVWRASNQAGLVLDLGYVRL